MVQLDEIVLLEDSTFRSESDVQNEHELVIQPRFIRVGQVASHLADVW